MFSVKYTADTGVIKIFVFGSVSLFYPKTEK